MCKKQRKINYRSSLPPFVKKNVKNRRPPVKNVKNVINPRPASNGLAVGDRFTSASLE
jgi:hypothetical protein